MLSRVANSIYWMSRYLERADNVARFIDVNARLTMDLGFEPENMQWDPLVQASGDEELYKENHSSYDEQSVIHFLMFDTENPNSIIQCIQNARENARTVREVISSEMWETLNALYHMVQRQSKRTTHDIQAFCAEIHRGNHLFSGHINNTMSHNEGWHFAGLGRMLERADKTARILDVKYFILLPGQEFFDSPLDALEWGAVLKSVSGFEMYRKQFHRANFRDVAQFLILDDQFPRSIRFCIQRASHYLGEITGMLDVKVRATKEMDTLKSSLENIDIESILNQGLHEYIDTFQYNLNVVDSSIYKSFFSLEREHVIMVD